MSEPAVLLFLLISAVVLFISRERIRRRSPLPLPPGPKKLPLLGNLLDMPATRQWETFHRWSREADSDIIHLDVAGKSIIVLESMEAVRDLFDRRSSIYSDTPGMTMVAELCGWGWAIGFMKYGDAWRQRRKTMHQSFGVTAAKQFRPQITAAAHALVARILDNPVQEDIMAEFKLFAGGLVLDIAYGIKVSSAEDSYILMAERAMHGLSEAGVPGRFLVDTFPVLKYMPEWMPGAGFKCKAAEWRSATLGIRDVPFDETRKQVLRPPSQPAACAPADTEPSIIRDTAGVVYAGGADTTVGVLGFFVFAMLQYPEVQAKAQRELDATLGSGVLPRFEDFAALPYVSALVKEVFRWRPIAALGEFHFGGYFTNGV
ncbi:hypothetical protein MKEN_00214700 [Mycena kentingensis (nom. inval.)]|nr:hypothetical protein MKEN_00214700 [Mycena kentingensis (nom. inval.)]